MHCCIERKLPSGHCLFSFGVSVRSMSGWVEQRQFLRNHQLNIVNMRVVGPYHLCTYLLQYSPSHHATSSRLRSCSFCTECGSGRGDDDGLREDKLALQRLMSVSIVCRVPCLLEFLKCTHLCSEFHAAFSQETEDAYRHVATI
ncbi:hypothetical protein HaLaN_11017 [Haematococcus lacustris]|uniref:Uncharacterized protein n=1 Tax=Haematococcus lacustris TaxID=44745 RepID=A0A699Z060_HAELA|nr:hypothetical protein HaLaN_11017 [Haematococcus lacustris]